jgi:hypothetical protein
MKITTPLVDGATEATFEAFMEAVLDFYNGPGYYASIRLAGNSLNFAGMRTACNALLPSGFSIDNFEVGTGFIADLNRINDLYLTLPHFFGGDLVYWYPMAQVDSLWLDTGRTTPATGAAGESIAGVTDRSGNGFHLSQSVAASRPFTEIVNGGLRAGFDGTADGMSSVTAVSYGGSEAVTVSAAVNKASDAASATVVSSATTGTPDNTANTYEIMAPTGAAGNNFRFGSRGATGLANATSASTFAAPQKGVLTGVGSTSSNISTLRFDGVQLATSTTAQGGGAYANGTLRVGFRQGSGGPVNYFNGSMGNLMALRRVASTNDLRIIREIGNRSIP